MQEYTGEVTETGGTNGQSLNGTNGVLTYSYIQIGDHVLKKVKAFTGISSKLEVARANGGLVTIYIHGKTLIGVKMPDGKIFSSGGQGIFLQSILLIILLAFGIPLSFFVIGLPFLIGAWFVLSDLRAIFAARALPNAIMI